MVFVADGFVLDEIVSVALAGRLALGVADGRHIARDDRALALQFGQGGVTWLPDVAGLFHSSW